MEIVIVIAVILLIIFIVVSVARNSNSGGFIDPRDGQEYRTVKIGDQVWMAENLNYEAEGIHTSYGQIYNWETAMKVCPPGWHLPSNEEWRKLVYFVGHEIAGKKLKATNGWANNGNGTDNYGFSALPNLRGYSDGSYGTHGLVNGDSGYWWSSTNDKGYIFYVWSIWSDDAFLKESSASILESYSVRCVQDQGNGTEVLLKEKTETPLKEDFLL